MNDITDFREFPKMARYSRECIITEKIDGTNVQIYLVPTTELSHGGDYPMATVVEDFSQSGRVAMFVGSRTRWIIPGADNYGFAAWAKENFSELKKLGPGRHFGEWWGSKIQRTYGRKDRVFSLFNVSRWSFPTLSGAAADNEGTIIQCCRTVPVIARGKFSSELVEEAMNELETTGSWAMPGFKDPEGIVIWHCAANLGFKKTLKNDEVPKSIAPRNPASRFNQVAQ